MLQILTVHTVSEQSIVEVVAVVVGRFQNDNYWFHTRPFMIESGHE